MENRRRAAARSAALRAAPRRARRQALIVDDESEFAELVAMWFRSAGWTAQVAEDGTAAMTLLADRRIDLVITDLQMSGMNGWELLRHLRSRWGGDIMRPHQPTHIVVVSGRTESDVARFACALGADAFLRKPVDRDTLFDTVTALFEPKQQPHGRPAARRGL